MALNVVDRIQGPVKIRNAIVSVWDKTGLDAFLPAVARACPGVRFYSTGGTYDRIAEILGPGGNLARISDFTGQPEMQGGLVKTLDFKIYLGLLSETFNDAHRKDISRVKGVDFDMAVVNLYPFEAASKAKGATPESSRGHIDIGGPCMLRAAAKNFLRVAAVSDPADYPRIAAMLAESGGFIGFAERFRLAAKTFAQTAAYDAAISRYLAAAGPDAAAACYRMEK